MMKPVRFEYSESAAWVAVLELVVRLEPHLPSVLEHKDVGNFTLARGKRVVSARDRLLTITLVAKDERRETLVREHDVQGETQEPQYRLRLVG